MNRFKRTSTLKKQKEKEKALASRGMESGCGWRYQPGVTAAPLGSAFPRGGCISLLPLPLLTGWRPGDAVALCAPGACLVPAAVAGTARFVSRGMSGWELGKATGRVKVSSDDQGAQLELRLFSPRCVPLFSSQMRPLGERTGVLGHPACTGTAGPAPSGLSPAPRPHPALPSAPASSHPPLHARPPHCP